MLLSIHLYIYIYRSIHLFCGPARFDFGISKDRFRVVAGDKVPHVGLSSTGDFSFALHPASAGLQSLFVFLALSSYTPPHPHSHPRAAPQVPTLSLVTVWRLDFLLNSFDKKLCCWHRVRERETRSLFPFTYPSGGLAARVNYCADLAGFHIILTTTLASRLTDRAGLVSWGAIERIHRRFPAAGVRRRVTMRPRVMSRYFTKERHGEPAIYRRRKPAGTSRAEK